MQKQKDERRGVHTIFELCMKSKEIQWNVIFSHLGIFFSRKSIRLSLSGQKYLALAVYSYLVSSSKFVVDKIPRIITANKNCCVCYV